jgi:hypothetical protein
MCRLHPARDIKEDDVMPLALGQSNPDVGSSPSFCSGRKLGDIEQALLWSLLQEDPQCPSRLLLDEAARRQRPIAVSLRQLNRWRVQWQLNRRQGRPRQTPYPGPAVSGAAVVRIRPRLSFVGVHLFAHWLDHQAAFDLVVAQLTQAIETHKHTHPDDDFALLHHREQTLRHRFQALFFAPLFGIEHLTEFDTREHPLATLLGHSYQSSTLTQFLGQLERVGADEALVPTLVPAQAGQITYIDGHMIAYWSRVAMHKGKITMRGRIMAGSQAVIAHNEAGYAVFVAYHPPDIHLSRIIVAYCHKVVEATGSTVFVIDRAVNSLAVAVAFTQQDWGLLCMLDDNEHHGLESFEATPEGLLDDGSQVYSGSWEAPKDDDDPRLFVIVVPKEGKPLVYWGTPQLKATIEVRKWPQLYHERTERQENSFKRMIDHGALETNYGRKKIVGPDRHQQRKREDLEASLETAQQRVANKVEALQQQQAKVAKSKAQGHGKRLEQRQQALRRVAQELEEAQHQQAKWVAQVAALGSPKERADRDFRKQTIMTCRTLLLENALMAFMAALLGNLQSKVSLACVLHMLLERSGAYLETASEIVYWVNTTGLSLPYRRLLEEVVDGLGAMDLRAQGKPIRVGLKDMPP